MDQPLIAPSGAEYIPLSPDDRIWFKKINRSELEELLAGPHAWVESKVQIPRAEEGQVRPAELANHFTILFETSEVAGNPAMTVHGIDGTGLITVRLNIPQGVEVVAGMPLSFPANEKILVRTRDQLVYSHLELKDMDSAAVAAYIMKFLVDTTNFLTQYNALPQQIDGVDVPDSAKKKFRAVNGRTIQVVYEGVIPPPPPPPPPPACNVDLGIEDDNGNVDIETFIVKAYK